MGGEDMVRGPGHGPGDGADDELAALLAIDALAADEQAEAELRLGSWPLAHADGVLPLAEAAAAEPPDGLLDDVLARARSRRPAGRPVHAPEPASPAAALEQTIAEFHALLASLADDEWDVEAHEEHGRVRDLVAHLIGVERLNLRWLDREDDVPYLPDHVASTRPVVDALADEPPAQLVEAWHAAALALLAAARHYDDGQDGESRPVPFHDITTSPEGLMTMRTFELWAHGMDIALATGRPVPMLDTSRLLLMSSRLMGAVPDCLAYRGVSAAGRTGRLVLTGPAGGCYDVALDLDATTDGLDPDFTIVADVVDICRLAAARLGPDELRRTVEGDQALADLVLAQLDAFARD
jgi:uncharacterized protein (TIGR03083 family)